MLTERSTESRYAEKKPPMISGYVQGNGTIGAEVFSVALIGPDKTSRETVAQAVEAFRSGIVRTFPSYPSLDELPRVLRDKYDVVIVELDSAPEYALELIESICGENRATVMVYSGRTDPELLLRCMRAGAREFLTCPISTHAIAEALIRASVRRPTTAVKTAVGQLFVFMGAKGGCGTSTVAANFAVSLAHETRRKTALLDLNVPLGSTALDLGLSTPFSALDALMNLDRLDSNFLSTLMANHNSGLSVLAAPDECTSFDLLEDSVEKLLRVVREDFEYVVVDAGVGYSPAARALLRSATTVYLVLQVSLPELRNANRLIRDSLQPAAGQLEIVLNRFHPRSVEIDEPSIAKALTMTPRWMVPNDFSGARKAQNSASPLVLGDSPVSRVLRTMARAAAGLDATDTKKRKFGLFGSAK